MISETEVILVKKYTDDILHIIDNRGKYPTRHDLELCCRLIVLDTLDAAHRFNIGK